MKKSLFFVVPTVAILALLVPVIAFAVNSGTTTVTGKLGVTIELSPPSAISLGDLIPNDWNEGSSVTPGTVTTNATSWTVTAIDQNTESHSGYMISGANHLKGKFQIGKNGTDCGNADSPLDYGLNPVNIPLHVKQYVWPDDKAGDYSITIVFTASAL